MRVKKVNVISSVIWANLYFFVVYILEFIVGIDVGYVCFFLFFNLDGEEIIFKI